jgi:hypothetical protein
MLILSIIITVLTNMFNQILYNFNHFLFQIQNNFTVFDFIIVLMISFSLSLLLYLFFEKLKHPININLNDTDWLI